MTYYMDGRELYNLCIIIIINNNTCELCIMVYGLIEYVIIPAGNLYRIYTENSVHIYKGIR